MLRYIHISLVLFAAFSLLLEVENSAIYALWYEVDNDSFAASYCINIDEPELDCAGSCRISSEMNSLDDASNNPMQVTKLASQETIHYFSPVSHIELPSYDFIRRVPFLFSVQGYHFMYVPSVFRPPTFLFG